MAGNIGSGKDTFIKYCLENGMAGTESSANAIYQVGKVDGVYLNILNSDGTVKDWEFFQNWLQIESQNPSVKVYNKVVRDRISDIIMNRVKAA